MRTVVALYDNFNDAQQAVQALHDSGFSRDDINLIARDTHGEYAKFLDQGQTETIEGGTGTTGQGAAAGAGIGAIIGGLGGLLVGLGTLAIPGVGPVLAAGPIISTLAGAGVGAVAGGIVGALVNWGIPQEHAQYYAEGVRRGGSLVVLRTDDARAEQARTVMNRFNPVDIETRAQAWRQNQWQGFNENGEPLPTDQMEFNREGDFIPATGTNTNTNTTMNNNTNMGTGTPVADMNNPQNTMGPTDEEVDIVEVFPVDQQDYARYMPDYQSDFQTRYGLTGYDYNYYAPAYQYGYYLANNPNYQGYEWNRLEPVARQQWQQHGFSAAWDDVKDAVQHAWYSVTNRF